MDWHGGDGVDDAKDVQHDDPSRRSSRRAEPRAVGPLETDHEEDPPASATYPGLPGPLPIGEYVVWQGRPRWHSLARQVFHTHLIAAYFAIIGIWRAATILDDGRGVGDVIIAVVLVVGTGALVVGLFELLAWLGARATVYTITNRRIVMRIGVALTKTFDIPFTAIESAELKIGPGGVGNISIKPRGETRLPYFLLWPHVRPWRLQHPQPTLRAVPNGQAVAETLASLLATSAQPIIRRDPATDAGSASPVTAPVTPTPFPRVPLLGAAALIAFVLITVAWVRLADFNTAEGPVRSPETIYQLSFEDLGADRLAIVDTALGETIAFVEPGRDGLIRNALRSLSQVRERRGLPTDNPYQLVYWDTGRLTLSDLETDRHIPIDSFGPADTGALAALLSLRDGGP